jgi:hypothetical protein
VLRITVLVINVPKVFVYCRVPVKNAFVTPAPFIAGNGGVDTKVILRDEPPVALQVVIGLGEYVISGSAALHNKGQVCTNGLFIGTPLLEGVVVHS